MCPIHLLNTRDKFGTSKNIKAKIALPSIIYYLAILKCRLDKSLTIKHQRITKKIYKNKLNYTNSDKAWNLEGEPKRKHGTDEYLKKEIDK